MLATSVRVSPCSALCRVSSEGRRTTTVSSSTPSASSGWIIRLISPFGPFTVIVRPSTWAVTPLGSGTGFLRSEEHTSELQSRGHLVCRLLLEKKKSTDSEQRKQIGEVDSATD